MAYVPLVFDMTMSTANATNPWLCIAITHEPLTIAMAMATAIDRAQ